MRVHFFFFLFLQEWIHSRWFTKVLIPHWKCSGTSGSPAFYVLSKYVRVTYQKVKSIRLYKYRSFNALEQHKMFHTMRTIKTTAHQGDPLHATERLVPSFLHPTKNAQQGWGQATAEESQSSWSTYCAVRWNFLNFLSLGGITLDIHGFHWTEGVRLKIVDW